MEKPLKQKLLMVQWHATIGCTKRVVKQAQIVWPPFLLGLGVLATGTSQKPLSCGHQRLFLLTNNFSEAAGGTAFDPDCCCSLASSAIPFSCKSSQNCSWAKACIVNFFPLRLCYLFRIPWQVLEQFMCKISGSGSERLIIDFCLSFLLFGVTEENLMAIGGFRTLLRNLKRQLWAQWRGPKWQRTLPSFSMARSMSRCLHLSLIESPNGFVEVNMVSLVCK